MPQFSKLSLDRLSTCDERLQRVLTEAIKTIDFTVMCGHRSQQDQDKAYAEGKSKVKFPNSKHNTSPSRAVDIAPWPIDWKDRERFVFLAGHVLGIASALGIKLRWGGDWDGDKNLKNNSFMDLPHFEVVD